MHQREILHFHVCGGAGGGKKGFNRGRATVGDLEGVPRCIGGVDVDLAGIADFNRIKGAPATMLDLFTEEQFIAFHGGPPPAGWREAIPDDFRRAAHGERPHVVFMSTPCKGFSGLLSEKLSTSAKYQALNGLTLRAVWLTLEAWGDDPPEFILFENVPRIATRGRWLLDQICGLLRSYGYAVAETTHDCGEIGGLGQSRKRFLLVARHIAKVPPFLYEPEKKRLKGVGEILDQLPLPGCPSVGPMHRVPALQWKTWVRLAFVEAGSDWRSLNRLRVEDGKLLDFGIEPTAPRHNGSLGVRRWEDPVGTIAGASLPSNGTFAVADVRPLDELHNTALGVHRWDEHSGTVKGRSGPTNGAHAVADPRPGYSGEYSQLGVLEWGDTAGTVTGQQSPGQGPLSVSDPRLPGKPAFSNVFRIVPWADPSVAVTGPGGPANGAAVADPRAAAGFGGKGKYRVTGYREAAGTVIGASTTGQGAFALADPRPQGEPWRAHTMGVLPYDQPAGTVTGRAEPTTGRFAVADPRPGYPDSAHTNLFSVAGFEETGRSVTGARHVAGGALSVADPRCTWADTAHRNKLKVTSYEAPAGTVTGADRVGSGAQCVADPRPDFAKGGRDAYQNGGHYGVNRWEDPSFTVPAHPKNNNGRWSVADPRAAVDAGQVDADVNDRVALPVGNERLVAVIQALDGTWHRPFTTYELAALQGYVDPGEVLEMDGSSDSAWRERIGNMVPPPSAAEIMSIIARTLLLSWAGETFVLSSTPIWVRPVALALSIDIPEIQD